MKIGIFPDTLAVKWDIHVRHKLIYASLWRAGSPYVDTVLLTVRASTWGTYTNKPASFAATVASIYLALKPAVVVIENEELLHNDIKDYCNELTAAANICPNVTNGGLVLPQLSYWYYTQTKDQDFFIKNIPTQQKQPLLDGERNADIADVQYELDVLKSLPIPFINVHYYFALENQAPGLVRMFNYLKQYTGKPVIANEAGIFAPGILPLVVDVARQVEMEYLILYSGTGTSSALPITKTDFENAVK